MPERRISVLGYADDLALVSSSAAGAQILFDDLVKTARRVGLIVNASKTVVLSVPESHVNILFDGNPLPQSRDFVYLGGQVPNSAEDITRRKRLAWSTLARLRVVFASEAMSDGLRARLFYATVESVLLYNAVTWTLTSSLESKLDAAHSHLLRAAFNIYWPQRVRNIDLYRRAGLQPPSTRLREERRALVGRAITSEETCPQPLQHLLLWQPTQRQRRGQGRRITFPEILMKDFEASNAEDIRRSVLEHKT